MIKIYKILSLAAVMLILGGCKKYLDINTNPAVPQESKAEFLLAPLTFQMANGTIQDSRLISKITQDWVGISADIESLDWEKHGFQSQSDVGGVIWRMTYVDLGLNLENMISDGIQNKKYEYVAIGYAMKAWAYQQCTDLHGPIILDGAFEIGKLSFPYKDQPEVYERVREWGNLSLKYMSMKSPVDQTSKLNHVTGDNMYRGDMLKWRKFVYGLFALQYSHLTNKEDFKTKYADSVIKYTDLSFANTTEDATIYFSATSTGDVNPFGPTTGYLISTYYHRPSTNIVAYLTGKTRGDTLITDTSKYIDPRLRRMLVAPVATTAAGKFVGGVPTKGTTNNVTTIAPLMGYVPQGGSLVGHYLFTDAARRPIMTHAQLQFAKAEALFYKNDKGEAYTAYINGIISHMNFINLYGRTSPNIVPAITSVEVDKYIKSTEVAQTAADLQIKDIMGQKYIAQWGWAALESWTDIRKYHYDKNIYRNYYQLAGTEIFTANKGKFAYRFRPRYNSEYVWNEKELIKWGGLDPDYMTKELWFSKP